MHWYLDVLKKYCDFSGRAGRAEFWMFGLIHFVITILIGLISAVFAGGNEEAVPWLAVLYSLATFLPVLGVLVRRLHDTGRSGKWWFISFIPFGGFVLLYFEILEGDTGTNAYGPSPLSQNSVSNSDSNSGPQNGQDSKKEPYVAKPRHNPAYK